MKALTRGTTTDLGGNNGAREGNNNKTSSEAIMALTKLGGHKEAREATKSLSSTSSTNPCTVVNGVQTTIMDTKQSEGLTQRQTRACLLACLLEVLTAKWCKRKRLRSNRNDVKVQCHPTDHS